MTDTTDTPAPKGPDDPAPEVPEGADAQVGSAPADPEAAADDPVVQTRPRRRSLLRRRSPAPAGDVPAEEPEQATAAIAAVPETDQATGAIEMPAPPRPSGGARLRRNRKQLMEQREELLFHLGGLAFELHRRGLLTGDAARRRAGMIASIDDAVREIDAQLTQLDEAKAARRGRVVVVESGVQEAGCCLECRAAFFEGARFCMQCGTAFAPTPTAVHEPGAGDTRILATGGS